MQWLWRFIIHLLQFNYFPEPVPDPDADEPNPPPVSPPDHDWSPQDKAILDLLALIGSVEAPKGYDQLSGFAESKVGRHSLTTMTLQQVRDLQSLALSKGSKSSAMGRYQILRKTLDGIVVALKLNWIDTRFTPAVQDRMAWFLLEGRGLKDFLAGRIDSITFANNLSKEWAALPVVTDMQGAHRWLKAGQSYYSGDGLNAAHLPPVTVLTALEKVKAAARLVA